MITNEQYNSADKYLPSSGSCNRPGKSGQNRTLGMSNAYRVAIDEGGNMVRIGSKIFGEAVEET